MCCLGFSIYQDVEARFSGKRRKGGLSLLSDPVISITVPSLPVITPVMVPLSEEEFFFESEGHWNCHCGDDVSTYVPKRLWLMVLL